MYKQTEKKKLGGENKAGSLYSDAFGLRQLFYDLFCREHNFSSFLATSYSV